MMETDSTSEDLFREGKLQGQALGYKLGHDIGFQTGYAKALYDIQESSALRFAELELSTTDPVIH